MKKIWNQALPLIVASAVCSGAAGGWKLLTEEVKFHREVRADIALIKERLGITQKESETHVADRN
jgi:hypothetical protein